jgi:hypothetical protein
MQPMIASKDARIDDYIKELPAWQGRLADHIRELIHVAEPGIEETIKRAKLPYFTLKGNVCAFMGTKDHLNVLIYDPIAPDPQKIVNQGEGNKTARGIQMYEGDSLDGTAFVDLIKAVVANNRAGGWRKLSAK